jgi:hypothetical protein
MAAQAVNETNFNFINPDWEGSRERWAEGGQANEQNILG